MDKLVQYVEWNLPNVMPNKMYCYGEANFEANQVMQEPLEKLYKYENQPDMREKVKEYISELGTEIDRCTKLIENKTNKWNEYGFIKMKLRVQILMEVKNDLQGRLEELF